MPKNKIPDAESEKQTIEQLTARYNELNTKKIQAQTKLANAESQLDELRTKAKKTYGTDDLDELKKQLECLKAENENKRATYQASLEKIEGDLAKIELKSDSPNDLEPGWDDI